MLQATRSTALKRRRGMKPFYRAETPSLSGSQCHGSGTIGVHGPLTIIVLDREQGNFVSHYRVRDDLSEESFIVLVHSVLWDWTAVRRRTTGPPSAFDIPIGPFRRRPLGCTLRLIHLVGRVGSCSTHSRTRMVRISTAHRVMSWHEYGAGR